MYYSVHTRLETAGFLCLSSSSSFEAGKSDAYALIPSMVVLPPKVPSALQFLAATFSPTWKHQTLRYSVRVVISHAPTQNSGIMNQSNHQILNPDSHYLRKLHKKISTCIMRSIPSNAILTMLPTPNSLSNT